MPAKKKGRPTDYSEGMDNQICEAIALGSNLNRLSEDEVFPSRPTMYSWFREFPSFLNNYTRAREARADSRSDRIDEICKKIEEGKLEPNAGRVIIDAEKWQAGKEKPSRYGEKTQLSNAAGDGDPTFNHITRTIVDPKGKEE